MHKVVTCPLVGVVLITLSLLALPAHAAPDAYMTVVGAQQGPIAGSVSVSGREGTFEINEFHHLTTGIKGGVGHQPFIVTTRLDKGIPPLLQALENGEILAVSIDLYRISPIGVAEVFYSFHLQNARLVVAEPISPDNERSELAALPPRIRLRFEFDTLIHNAVFAGESVEL